MIKTVEIKHNINNLTKTIKKIEIHSNSLLITYDEYSNLESPFLLEKIITENTLILNCKNKD